MAFEGGHSAVSAHHNRPASPPHADLAFRVGIVGHRPDRLPKDPTTHEALRRMLRRVLEEVKAQVQAFAQSDRAKRLYSSNAPVLRAASPLAEGSDRIFAEEALDLGYELLSPMPFHREEFEQDFQPKKALEPNSLERFRRLLDRARAKRALTTFELDGAREAEEHAYGASGQVVLNQSDLLIAVWDGGRPAGGGGTVETLREAIHYHVPVLWIYSAAPNAWQLLSNAEDLKCLDDGEQPCRPTGTLPADSDDASALVAAIKNVVTQELDLTTPPVKLGQKLSTGSVHAERYFRERRPCFNFALVWKLFRDFVAGDSLQIRSRLRELLVEDFETQISGEWPTLEDKPKLNDKPTNYAPSAVEDWVNVKLRAHYAWTDKRGALLADAYRSAYVLIYLLSTVAVFMALLPLAADLEGRPQIISVAFELSILVAILSLVGCSRWRHWQDRWMEYRLLAELIRQVRILIPLGGGRPFPRVPIHLGVYGNLDQTWMYWQMRAVARAAGIPTATVTPGYTGDCLNYIAETVGGQLGFHKNTQRRSHRIWHHLHLASTILFLLTLFVIVIHLLLGILHFIPPKLSEFLKMYHADRWLVLLAATLPALGAAMTGIANQGEFARLAKRSLAMSEAFAKFAIQIEALQRQARDGTLKLSQVIPLARKIAAVMVDEVADWRVIVVEQPVRTA
jgi:hypothetical protein